MMTRKDILGVKINPPTPFNHLMPIVRSVTTVLPPLSTLPYPLLPLSPYCALRPHLFRITTSPIPPLLSLYPLSCLILSPHSLTSVHSFPTITPAEPFPPSSLPHPSHFPFHDFFTCLAFLSTSPFPSPPHFFLPHHPFTRPLPSPSPLHLSPSLPITPSLVPFLPHHPLHTFLCFQLQHLTSPLRSPSTAAS